MSGALKSVGSAIGSVGQQLFGGSSSRSRQQSGIDPRFFNMFASNLERATGVAEGLGPRQFADFTPDFQAGAQALRGVVGGPGQQTLGQGVSLARRVGQFEPTQVQAPDISALSGTAASIDRSNVREVDAGAFPGGDLDRYMNPYIGAVVDATLADLDRQRQLQQQQVGHAATQAGAFGGSRHGVAEAETNRAFADTAARTAAGLRQQGFDSAAGLMQQDLNRRLQAQGLNQQADTSVAGQNALLQQQMALANLGYANEAAQLGAGLGLQAQLANQQAGLAQAQQQLGAAGLLGQLGGQQQQMGLQGAAALLGLGELQRQQQQQQLDAIRNLPLEQQAIINQALGINPGGGSGMQSSGSSRGDSYSGFMNWAFPQGK